MINYELKVLQYFLEKLVVVSILSYRVVTFAFNSQPFK